MTIRWFAGLLFLCPGMAMAALFGNLFAGSPPAGLGATNGRLAACPAKPNCVSSQATDTDHLVAPLAFTGPARDAMAQLARVISAQSGARVVEEREDYVRAAFQTPLMGFVDDVEFLLDPGRQVIDVRSASRLGHSDFGVNRKRVEALRAAFAGGAA
jgi:uncharacterized protein (DUF1499 family)